MATSNPHRKRVRHFNEPSTCHELTFSCYRRLALLTDAKWLSMLGGQLDRAMLQCDFSLVAFVCMPEHVHLLVYGNKPGTDVSRLLKAIKRPLSFRIKRCLAESASPLLSEFTIRERPGVKVFRFWQEGPGYDRNLDTVQAVLGSIDYIT